MTSINNELQIFQWKNWEIQVKVENETIWLNQEQIATLFGVNRPAIIKHINNIFKEWELDEKVVCSILELTTPHWAIANKTQQKNVKIYNLDD
jgi:hypothetical protein